VAHRIGATAFLVLAVTIDAEFQEWDSVLCRLE